MTFQERAKLAMEALLRQPPVTLYQVRAQVQSIKDRNEVKNKKGKDQKKMKQMTFQELTILSMEALSKQLPVSVEQARAQVQRVKHRCKGKKKKAKRE